MTLVFMTMIFISFGGVDCQLTELVSALILPIVARLSSLEKAVIFADK